MSGFGVASYGASPDDRSCAGCGASELEPCRCPPDDSDWLADWARRVDAGQIDWAAECDAGNVDIMSGIPLDWWDGR